MRFPCTSALVRCALVLALAGGAGCAKPADESVLERARAAAGANDWATALDAAKQYTLDHPESSAGHYLLGQAYYHGTPANLAHARGEMHMALELYHTHGDWEPFETEGMSAEAYELALHKDMARVHLRWILDAMDHRLPPKLILERIAQCRQNIGRGRTLDPADPQFMQLEENLDRLETMLTRAQSTPDFRPGNDRLSGVVWESEGVSCTLNTILLRDAPVGPIT